MPCCFGLSFNVDVLVISYGVEDMLPGVCLGRGAVQPRLKGGEEGCGEMRGLNQQWLQDW